jgi:hypothetical protein
MNYNYRLGFSLQFQSKLLLIINQSNDHNSRAQRLGTSSEIHFLDIALDELLRRLAALNAQPSQILYHIREETMQPWIAFFLQP